MASVAGADGADLTATVLSEDSALNSRLTQDLHTWLMDEAPQADIRRRSDPMQQDLGVTLAIILGSASVTAVARGIALWLQRRQDAKLVLERTKPNGETLQVTVSGQLGSRAQETIREFLTK